MEINLNIDFNGYTISWGIGALLLLIAIIVAVSYKCGGTLAGSRGDLADSGKAALLFGLIACLIGGIFYWTRDSKEFHDNAKVLIRTSFDDGAELYKVSGKYGYVDDSSDCSEDADIHVIWKVEGRVVTSYLVRNIPYKSLRVVPDEQFYNNTGIEPPPK